MTRLTEQRRQRLRLKGVRRRPDQRPQHRFAGHAVLSLQRLGPEIQPVDQFPTEPLRQTTHHLQTGAPAATPQALAGSGAAETHHLGPQPAGTRFQLDPLALGVKAVGVEDQLLGEPLQIGIGGKAHHQLLLDPAALRRQAGAPHRAVDLLRRHAGEQRPGAGVERQLQPEPVATHQATTGVQDRQLTASAGQGPGPLQPQRSNRTSLVKRGSLAALKMQPGMGVPTYGRLLVGLPIQLLLARSDAAVHTHSLAMSHDAGLTPQPDEAPLVLRRRQPGPVGEAATELRLSLSADERTRLRGARRSVCGRSLLLQLPREQPLQPGERLLSDDPGAPVVRVEAAAEAVLVVRASGPLALLQAAYHLGNRHVAMQLQTDQLILLDDPVLAALLRQRGLEVEPRLAPFLPEGGAYEHGHGHGQSHSHSHGQDHDHEHSHG